MKSFLLSLTTLIAFNSFAQETTPPNKKDNFFISTELSNTLGKSDAANKYGFSLAYNRLLSKSHFGIGAAVDLIDIRTKKMGGVMPSLDLRYYATLGKSTLMPMAQVGYNFYKYQYHKLAGDAGFEEKGGLGYTLGIGYSYPFTDKGNGLYGALRFRGLQYKYDHPQMQQTMNSNRLNLSIGWRF
jgi:hypothetical protein